MNKKLHDGVKEIEPSCLFSQTHCVIQVSRAADLVHSLNSQTQARSKGDCLAMQLDCPTLFHNPTRKPARYAVVIASETVPKHEPTLLFSATLTRS